MTAGIPAGAVTHREVDWCAIDWRAVHREVRRLQARIVKAMQGRADLLALWKEQGGTCPVCGQKITQETRWHDHHIVWRSEGGGDNLSNRVLAHPDCHRQIHSQRLDVAKPRLERGV